jgi:hypothetical protein
LLEVPFAAASSKGFADEGFKAARSAGEGWPATGNDGAWGRLVSTCAFIHSGADSGEVNTEDDASRAEKFDNFGGGDGLTSAFCGVDFEEGLHKVLGDGDRGMAGPADYGTEGAAFIVGHETGEGGEFGAEVEVKPFIILEEIGYSSILLFQRDRVSFGGEASEKFGFGGELASQIAAEDRRVCRNIMHGITCALVCGGRGDVYVQVYLPQYLNHS